MMRRGAAAERLVGIGAACMGVLAALTFLAPDAIAAAGLAIAACAVGGLVPAACFALIPRAVPQAALVAPTVGLVIQGNNLAQLLAPPLLGTLAGVGWWLVSPPLLLCGVLAVLAARALGSPLRGAAAPS